jgi:hypothetical protein
VLLLLSLQIFELMRGLDKDCDATINLEEFASRFEVVFTRLNDKLSTTAAAGGVGVVPGGAVLSLEQALVMQRLARLVYKRWHSLEEVKLVFNFMYLKYCSSCTCSYMQSITYQKVASCQHAC